jgi:hypothetical protein
MILFRLFHEGAWLKKADGRIFESLDPRGHQSEDRPAFKFAPVGDFRGYLRFEL